MHKPFLLTLLVAASLGLHSQTPLAPNAPADKVYTVTNDRQEAIKALVAQARATWPSVKSRFAKGLPPRHVLFLSAQLTDTQNHKETVFIEVQKIESGNVLGVLASELASVTGFRPGQKLSIPEIELLDWTISKPDGSEEGNLIGKYLESHG
ncbi:MAG TPA: DUF2314 domain-containing protein [Geothrix sp.]|nr:DUF2314 domain-containing protein [Geothrix sp.]